MSSVRLCRMTACGPSRHIAPPRDFGRQRSIAEVDGQPSIAEDDTRDPLRSAPGKLAKNRR
jgi:hypothetical protein